MSERIPPIGTMTDRVQIRRKEMTGEDEGGHTTLYVPMATVWARVRSLTGRRLEQADGPIWDRGIAWSIAGAISMW
jgi:head-tail adaptor